MRRLKEIFKSELINIEENQTQYAYTFEDPANGQLLTVAQFNQYLKQAKAQKVAYEFYYEGSLSIHINASPHVICRENRKILKNINASPLYKDFSDQVGSEIYTSYTNLLQYAEETHAKFQNEHLAEYNITHNMIEAELRSKRTQLQHKESEYKKEIKRLATGTDTETKSIKRPIDHEEITRVINRIERKESEIRGLQNGYRRARESEKNLILIEIEKNQDDLQDLTQELKSLQNPGYDIRSRKKDRSFGSQVISGINAFQNSGQAIALRNEIEDLEQRLARHRKHNTHIQAPYYKMLNATLTIEKICVKFIPESISAFSDKRSPSNKLAWARERQLWQGLSIIVGLAALIAIVLLAQYASTIAIVSLLDPSTEIAVIWTVAGICAIADFILVFMNCLHLNDIETAKIKDELQPYASEAFNTFMKAVGNTPTYDENSKAGPAPSAPAPDADAPPAYTPHQVSYF